VAVGRSTFYYFSLIVVPYFIFTHVLTVTSILATILAALQEIMNVPSLQRFCAFCVNTLFFSDSIFDIKHHTIVRH